MGESYAGLKILKQKFNLNKNIRKYFEKKYYQPELHLRLSDRLINFANTSIDISDGLIADLEKLINKQKLSYTINLDDIPISSNLRKLIKIKKWKKISVISQGDDYQILFTATPSKTRIIRQTFKSLGIKISKIGKISSSKHKNLIIDKKGEKIAIKNKGYSHKF